MSYCSVSTEGVDRCLLRLELLEIWNCHLTVEGLLFDAGDHVIDDPRILTMM
jgi:hypothetical protein